MVKVRADQDVCCGAGQCVMLGPEIFDQDEDNGLVIVLDPEPATPELQAKARHAAAVCPAAAITVHPD
jgi:ferredoxin